MQRTEKVALIFNDKYAWQTHTVRPSPIQNPKRYKQNSCTVQFQNCYN